LEQAVERITGEEGTPVSLGLRGAGSDKVREVKLVRASIRIDSIKGWQRKAAGGWDYRIDPELQIGYIRLTTFGPNTATDLDRAVEQMVEQGGLRGLVLDLRFNPGGRLDSAIDVSNRFLEEGTIVSTTQKTFLGRPWRAAADRHHTYASFPVVVLVNKGSASASEIVSGALQAHKRALVIGERSFGKGSVQNLFPIGGNAAYLKLTTQYYRLPDNRIIHRRPDAKDWGISPDVAVAVTDAQVAAAIEARMILDVLPGAGEKAFNPALVISKPDPKDEDADRQELKRKAQAVRKADDLLTQGLDPQLNTALLLLQARVIGQRQG
ncbi:MAG: S41 family peptidase, partial [Phycisphaerae bacterium]|nr:S41 family peptidase [Phycisphaerae bacterium]